MPRSTSSAKKAPRHNPLHHDLGQDEELAKHGRVASVKRTKRARTETEDNSEGVLDATSSRKIFELAKDQREEIEEEEWVNEEQPSSSEPLNGSTVQLRPTSIQDDDENDDEVLEDADEEEYEEYEIDPEDLETLDKLLPKNAGESRTLADIIFDKIDAAEKSKPTGSTSQRVYKADGSLDPAAGLDPKIVAVYTKVGELLQRGRYKSGPVPKVFKILPSHAQWARYLALTNPQNWSPQATLVATKIFISNLKPEQAKVYLEGVVLPNVREDIRENNGKLNVHLYDALKKGLYKPAAFFKGILFPLCKDNCTLKEASIVSSVLSRVHVPVLHSAAALLRLANLEYSGPNSLFIRVLLDKKYALPFQVVDGLWSHFIRLSNTYKGSKSTSEKLPVLWHQSLLVFCQRYASDLTPDQKDALLDVVRVQFHPQIGPEIRRELVNSVARGEPRPAEDGDVEMRD